MKVLTYAQDGVERLGILSQDMAHILPVPEFPSMLSLLECDPNKRAAVLQQAVKTSQKIPLEQTEKRSPLPEPRDSICIGYNFKSHAQEISQLRGESAQSAEISYPIYFSKRTAQATGDGDAIPYVKGYAENLDCGVEVAVVIGRDALNVPPEKVSEYIFGYTIANDVCDTRLNKIYTQPFHGKSIDGYMPFGPWIVTTDEFPADPVFHLRLFVNDKIRQEGTTASLVFSIPYIVSELSTNMTLKAGAIISTGSPANRDAGQPEKLKLWPGDVIRCEIDGIGSLTNIVQERGDREDLT